MRQIRALEMQFMDECLQRSFIEATCKAVFNSIQIKHEIPQTVPPSNAWNELYLGYRNHGMKARPHQINGTANAKRFSDRMLSRKLLFFARYSSNMNLHNILDSPF